jgi:hypothetical protein
MTVTIIRTDGREETHDLSGDTWPAIKRLMGAKYLSTVNLRDGRIMLVDDLGYEVNPQQTQGEDGILYITNETVRPLKPENQKATALYHSVCKPGTTHKIVGDVAIVVDKDFGDDDDE